MSGLLDSNEPITEEGAATEIMQELGFETAPEPEPVVEDEPQPEPGQATQVDVEDEPAMVGDEEGSMGGEFEEAERRMSKAILYRQLIKGRFFDGTGELVLEVEAELKDFVKKQYLILSGAAQAIAVPVAERDFTEEEVTVLKSLAERVLKNPKLQEPPKTPQLQPRPVQRALAPVAPPVAKKPPVAPAKKPQLQVRKVPEDVTPVAKPAPKPVAKPAQKPQQAKRPIGPPVLAVPEDDSVVEENGQKFKIRYVDMPNIDEFGLMDGSKIRRLADKQGAMLSNGIQVFKDGASIFKILRSALTNNTNIPGRLPFPTNDQFSTITQNNSLTAVSKLPPTLGAILGRR